MNLLPRKGPGRPRTKAPEIRTTVIISDLHLPLIDWPSYYAVKHFIAEKRPDYLFLDGDIIDCAEQSHFEKNPKIFGQTEEELQLANQVLDELQQTSPTTIIKYCEDCQWSA
jgi:UDP-2,3-diacylglucosamine pyrophosphatase LpxH